MQVLALLVAVVLAFAVPAQSAAEVKHHHHHHKHHKHHKNHDHGKSQEAASQTVNATAVKAVAKTEAVAKEAPSPASNASSSVEEILKRMKSLEDKLATHEKASQAPTQGKVEVNGPLPADFDERFIQATAFAAGCHPGEIEVLDTQPLGANGDLFEIVFQAPRAVVLSLEHQAADPASKLAHSPIRSFLIARDDGADEQSGASLAQVAAKTPEEGNQQGIDIDTAMPYGELEPFGREDTAQELTESSVKESDEMVDQLERAEVAEEKRAVFRALTRLRGAAITSFDGVARSQTGNIDEYNKVHQWRSTHPLHHLADEESDISKWAFPDNADF